MEEQVDIVGMLPPEIADLIMILLEPKDLWSCLYVSKRWRQLSNVKKYWDRHLLEINEDPICDNMEETNFDILCLSAKQWSDVQMEIKNWKLQDFEKFPFPDSLESPVFCSYENHVAVLDRLEIKTYRVENTGLACSSKIVLPSYFERKHNIKDGGVLMNKSFLVYKNKVFLIVYRREESLVLESVFIFKISGKIDVMIGNEISDDLFLLSNDSRPCCAFSYLFEHKLWISYTIDSHKLSFHFLIDLQKSEVKKINPPIKGKVLRYEGIKNRILLEFVDDLIIYDTDGNVLFYKDLGDDSLCASVNENVVVVLNSRFIQAYDILTGKELSQINNAFYLPQLYVSPVADVVFVAQKGLSKFEISAFNVRSKLGKLLWTNNIDFVNRVMCNSSRFFYGMYLYIFSDGILFENMVNKLSFIDSRNGETIIKTEISGSLVHFSKKFFIKEVRSRYVLFKA